MYLHLGNDSVIKQSEIIGIFDIDTATVSKISRDYLTRKEKEGNCNTISYDLPKSFVVCFNKNKEDVYISQISTATLQKRTEEIL